jgi:hypothetical protein
LQSGENLRKNSRKRAEIELWKAKVPLSYIRKQLKMSESTLRNSGGCMAILEVLLQRTVGCHALLAESGHPTRMQEVLNYNGDMIKYLCSHIPHAILYRSGSLVSSWINLLREYQS